MLVSFLLVIIYLLLYIYIYFIYLQEFLVNPLESMTYKLYTSFICKL
jgi:hypothetical protein